MASAVRSAVTVMMTSAVAPALISMAVLLPREQQELQAHHDQEGLDHCQKTRSDIRSRRRRPIQAPPNMTAPRTRPTLTASAPSSAYRVNTAPRVTCRASAHTDSVAM